MNSFCSTSPDAATGHSRRAWLAAAWPWVAGSLLLAGCGSPPRRTALAGRSHLATPHALPSVSVVNPIHLPSGHREEAVARAMLTVNTPYTYGGNTLEGGFDCSGLVQYVFNSFAGRPLPRSTMQWAQSSLPVEAGQLQRGDLVFFNTSGRAFSHMGIYIGNRQFVHAPSTGGTVRTASMDNSYFSARFDGGRTLFS